MQRYLSLYKQPCGTENNIVLTYTILFVVRFSSMNKQLISWIGSNDLKAAEEGGGLGPIASLLEERKYDRVLLLCNYAEERMVNYQEWLSARSSLEIKFRYIPLPNGPANHRDIYEAVEPFLNEVFQETSVEVTYFISPGTNQMASIWVVLGKTKYPGAFVQSSEQAGIEDVEIPFDLAADYLPDLRKSLDHEINKIASGEIPTDPAFDNFIATSGAMKSVVRLAHKVVNRTVTVLIEGSPGTGKELLARCMHEASGRDRLIKVDCASYSEEKLEEELFGNEIGAFDQAESGTLFLSRLEELSDRLQVRLIDSLTDDQFSNKNVRVIAAADTNLREEVKHGRFRQELYFQLSAANLFLPDIRKRGGDLSALVNHFFDRINQLNMNQTEAKSKKLSAGARRALLDHSWPGNVTELVNTIQRAILWTDTATIREEDMRSAVLEPIIQDRNETILDRDIENGVDIQAIIKEVEMHYLQRAWRDSGFNKKRTAQMLGLSNYQTASNWLERNGIA